MCQFHGQIKTATPSEEEIAVVELANGDLDYQISTRRKSQILCGQQVFLSAEHTAIDSDRPSVPETSFHRQKLIRMDHHLQIRRGLDLEVAALLAGVHR